MRRRLVRFSALWAILMLAIPLPVRAADITELQLSAEQGDATAQFMVGNAYELGLEGLPIDLLKAHQWYERAAKGAWGETAGSMAMGALGSMYYSGKGVIQNRATAANLFEMSVSLDPLAAWRLENLGYMYNEGDGVVQDHGAAFKWWFWGASLGSAYSGRNLSYLYMFGRGVDRDFARAHMWLNIAGAGGDEGAREIRDRMVEHGTLSRAEIENAQALAREWHAGTDRHQRRIPQDERAEYGSARRCDAALLVGDNARLESTMARGNGNGRERTYLINGFVVETRWVQESNRKLVLIDISTAGRDSTRLRGLLLVLSGC